MVHSKRPQAIAGRYMVKSSSPNALSSVLDSSFFALVLTLHRRTYLHSATSVPADRIGCVVAAFAFRKRLFINKRYRICLLDEHHVIYSFRYYLRFHLTALGLGTYYPWVREHTCISPVDKTRNRRTNHETCLRVLFPPILHFIVLQWMENQLWCSIYQSHTADKGYD
jgi:hypothetical protein